MNRAVFTAGLFEGEGCINISRQRTRTGGWQWLLNVTVKMSDREPIDMLAERWKGAVHVHPVREGRKPLYSWRATARDAEAFLSDIEPHLITGRRQAAARLGIAFQRQKRNYGRSYPLAYLERQDDYYHQMKALNSPPLSRPGNEPA